MRVERGTEETLGDWLALRRALWPHVSEQRHRLEAAATLARANDTVAFVARETGSMAVGFAEATLRREYVSGCVTSPVAFLEGIYVHEDWRKRGVARALCQAVEGWAADHGCSEFASDVDLRNEASQVMHGALGFEETERVVFYRKKLTPAVLPPKTWRSGTDPSSGGLWRTERMSSDAGIFLRQAEELDIPILITLLRRSWLRTWAPEVPFEAVQVFASADPARGYALENWPAFLVATLRHEVVGMIHTVQDCVESLHVDPRMKRIGIGTKLLAEAERRIAQGHPSSRLEVRAFNTEAIAFYAQRGWKETRRYIGHECGSPVETIEFRKALVP